METNRRQNNNFIVVKLGRHHLINPVIRHIIINSEINQEHIPTAWLIEKTHHWCTCQKCTT